MGICIRLFWSLLSYLSITLLGVLPTLALSSLTQSLVLLVPPQEKCRFLILCPEI